jgi:hypothetical protein
MQKKFLSFYFFFYFLISINSRYKAIVVLKNLKIIPFVIPESNIYFYKITVHASYDGMHIYSKAKF